MSSYSAARVKRNAVGVLLSSFVNRFASVILNVFARRAIGPAMIGAVGWNTALIAYFSLLTNPGIQTITKRDAAAKRDLPAQLVSRRVTAQIVLALPTFLLLLATNFFFIKDGARYSLLYLQAVSLITAAFNLSWLLEAHERMVVPAAINAIFLVLQIPFVVYCVRGAGDAHLFVLITVVTATLTAVATIILARRYGLIDYSQLRFRLDGFWALSRESFPLTVSTMATFIYGSSAAFILGLRESDKSVGIFTTAYSLMQAGGLVTSAISTAFTPSLVRANENPGMGEKVVNDYNNSVLWLTVPVVALGHAYGQHVVSLMFGREFETAGEIFRWLCLNLLGAHVAVAAAGPLAIWGRQKDHAKITTLAACFHLGLSAVLIYRYSIFGAVIASIISEWVVAVGGIFCRRGLFPFPKWLIVKVVVSSLLLSVVLETAEKYIPWPVVTVGVCAGSLALWSYLKRRAARSPIA